MAHDQSHTWRWKACNAGFICHILSTSAGLCRKVYANHSTKRARVAPVKLVRHMGHCRSAADSWHFLHTECPHGTRATRCLFSWQMGQWPLMPCGWVVGCSGRSFASFAMLQAAVTSEEIPRHVTDFDVKPCFPSQSFNNCKAQSRIIDGLSTSRLAVHRPFMASASQHRIKRCCTSFTHWSRHATLAASAFWPNCCAKAMSQRKISEEQLSLTFWASKCLRVSLLSLIHFFLTELWYLQRQKIEVQQNPHDTPQSKSNFASCHSELRHPIHLNSFVWSMAKLEDHTFWPLLLH